MTLLRTSFLLLCLGGSSFVIANAQSVKSSPLDELFLCQGIKIEAERLECFDSEVNKLYDGVQSSDILLDRDSIIEDIEKDSFGFSSPLLRREAKAAPKLDQDKEREVAEIQSPVTDNVEKTDASRPADKIVKKRDSKKALIAKRNELTILRVREMRPSKKLKLLFSNGQIWEQTDTTKLPGVKTGKAEGVKVVISKGSLGSYFLRVNGKGRAIKVKRTR